MDPLKKVTSLEPTKKAFSLFNEFKAFAFKGNVIDLAVGVVIGAAFTNIIQSLVKNIIMPLVSLVMPNNESYAKWRIPVGPGIPIGEFIADVVNFLIVALVLFFIIVKFLGWVMRTRKEEEAAAPPPLTKEQELLTEIRDLLKQSKPA